MGTTDSTRFDVYFRGECLDGAERATVRAALARLFRADTQTLDRLFSGELQRIKRDVDHATAEKYRAAMEQAGARPLIRPHGHGAAPAGAATAHDRTTGSAVAPAATASAAGPADERGLDLAPVGSDVLRPEERPRHDALQPATDHLSVAPVGDTLGVATEPPVPPRPAPDLDVAAVGTDLLDVAPRNAVTPPDSSHITLAVPDHDLSDCAPPAPDSPPPVTSHLAVAPRDGGLINEDERHAADAPAPGTDHLSLAEAPGDTESGDSGTDTRFDHR